ncbi:HNH endonuclease [Microbacterium protaetiae]|uniref:HNH endonuclease n=1 Tax=Microbacterium protaetiae TaxID=2509458 RepID=A0A4P6EEV0_9MICO|nr:HNH endonuclease signature motif containing protein [Microbacterium protaetiae]QAY59639.1 HNH endonuclease [Microbacterium protaetiae]
MRDPLAGLEDAVAALRRAWAGDAVGVAPAQELDRQTLVAVTEALGAVDRRLGTVCAQVAEAMDRQSRPELGADSLAKEHGYRNAGSMIAATMGIGSGEASRLVGVGKAIAPRLALTGEELPAKHARVAAAMEEGTLTRSAAALIIGMLDRVAVRTNLEDRDAAEAALTTAAPGLTFDQLRKLVAQAEAYLDQDGRAPTENERRGERYLRMFERDDFLIIDAKIPVVAGAPVKAAIQGYVSAAFREAKDDVIAGDDEQIRPSVPQLQADALVQLAEHALGCAQKGVPLGGVSVVVRLDYDTLTEGTGLATIDGIDRPISAAAARHLAASAGIIPAVLNDKSEIMNWGREKRLFTLAQRIALAERDGGCAMCNLPPWMTKAHHLNWWVHDHGETNLDEGVLLCEPCHHRVHDNGWEVRIEGTGRKARVWFIPPARVDPTRTPRLGGRARFDYAA